MSLIGSLYKFNSLACFKFTATSFTNKQMILNFKILSTLQLQFRQINFYISCFIAFLPIAGFFIKADDCWSKCEIKFERKTTA